MLAETVLTLEEKVNVLAASIALALNSLAEVEGAHEAEIHGYEEQIYDAFGYDQLFPDHDGEEVDDAR